MTPLMLRRHLLCVAPEIASMEGGARFRLDTSHHHPGPFITRCHAAAPRALRRRPPRASVHPALPVDTDHPPLAAVRHPTATHPCCLWAPPGGPARGAVSVVPPAPRPQVFFPHSPLSPPHL